MAFTIYELYWFYFLYSFIGWCIEVCIAAVQRKKFINRGFASSPLCPIYGTGAVAFAIVLPELRSNIFFLFLGGAILASLVEYITGVLLEKIFHRKWWDYSHIKYNYEGYVCLRYSLLWGVLAVLVTLFVNPFLASVIKLIPHFLGVIILWAMGIVLLLDTLGTSLTILGLQKKWAQLSQLTEGMEHVSGLLENAITRRISKRMEMAFPSLDMRTMARQWKQREKSTVFAEGCSFYKLFCLFFIGAFLGDIVETIFCLITMGKLVSRSSVVFGPFSVVWGIACALLTAILYRIKNRSDTYIFVAGTLLGGAYEYVCSVFTELVFGTIFWDYSGFAFNLGGRINLLYCFFWGIAAVIWMKLVYPKLSDLIERIPIKPGKIICSFLIIFMIFNCLLSALALTRYRQRKTNEAESQMVTEEESKVKLEEESQVKLDEESKVKLEEASQEKTKEEAEWTDTNEDGGLNVFLDKYFDDKRMEKIYPKAKIVK